MFDGILSCNTKYKGNKQCQRTVRRENAASGVRGAHTAHRPTVMKSSRTEGTAGARVDAPPALVAPPPTRLRADDAACRADARADGCADRLLLLLLLPPPPMPPPLPRADAASPRAEAETMALLARPVLCRPLRPAVALKGWVYPRPPPKLPPASCCCCCCC